MTGRRVQNGRYLTPKRAEFLKHFVSHPYLTTAQAYMLAKASTESDRRGLRRFLMLLWKSGYLLREPVLSEAASPFPHYQYSYRLSKRGAEVTHGHATAEKSAYSLAHDQEITQFHIELGRRWSDGLVYWQQTDLKKTVNPDALFAITADQTSAYYFFLEIERSRQGHYRGGESGLEVKLKRYEQYRRTAACKQDWNYFDDFRVVVVVKNAERLQNLLGKLAATLPHRFIWITSDQLYRRDILGQIFFTPKDFGEHGYSLKDL